MKQHLRALRTYIRQAAGIEPRVAVRLRSPLEFHGNEHGGWNIVASSLDATSVVVDVGLGEDISFSDSIIRKYGCVVCGFDPTPRAIRYVKDHANERLRLFELGVGPIEGRARFYLPNNADHVSGSVTRERHLGSTAIDVDLITVNQVFERLSCDRIDLLKLDIEGTEYDVIESADFQRRAGGIGQLCVEFHHRWSGHGKQSTEQAVRTLSRLGFDCAWYSRSTNEEFLFVRRDRFASRSRPSELGQ